MRNIKGMDIDVLVDEIILDEGIYKILEMSNIDTQILKGCDCANCSICTNTILENVEDCSSIEEIKEVLENGLEFDDLTFIQDNTSWSNDCLAVPDSTCIDCIQECSSTYYAFYCDWHDTWEIDTEEPVEVENQLYCTASEGTAFVYCYECEEPMLLDYAIWNEDDWHYYCEDCFPNQSNIKVYSYHEFNNYKPIGETMDGIYFGFEIETDSRDCWKSLNDFESITNVKFPNWETYFHAEEDGSIDGFEFISQPLSPTVAYKVIPLMLECLKEAGFYCSEGTGSHIHFTRTNKTKKAMENFLYFVHNNSDFIRGFCRRSISKMRQWSDFYSNQDVLKEVAITLNHSYKYRVINFSKRKTVEFRGFTGSLDATRVLGNMEFIQLMLLNIIDKNSSWEKLYEFSKFAQFENLYKSINELLDNE